MLEICLDAYITLRLPDSSQRVGFSHSYDVIIQELRSCRLWILTSMTKRLHS